MEPKPEEYIYDGITAEIAAYFDVDKIPELPTLTPAHNFAHIVGQLTSFIAHVEADRDSKNHLASTDSLTGLFNRRGMIDHIDRYLENVPDDGLAMLVIVDADNFKHLNDSFGHHNGDRALQTLAERLQGTVRDRERSADAVARVGGDEFMVFFDLGTDSYDDEDLVTIQKIFRERINHELRFSWTDEAAEQLSRGQFIEFGASIGMAIIHVSELRARQGSLSDILRLADKELYADKARPTKGAARLVITTEL